MTLRSTFIMFVNVIILEALGITVAYSCVYRLAVSNDGPVTLDVPVIISTTLECADDEEYTFVFEDDSHNEIEVSGHNAANATFVYDDEPGDRIVTVTAFTLGPRPIKVASGKTSVEVLEYIPGELKISGLANDTDGGLTDGYVAAGTETNISLEILYPRRVMREAEFSYSFKVGESRIIREQPFLVHRFADLGPQWIRASVVARLPPYDSTSLTRFKWGYFDSKVIVKNPFTHISISGNTYLKHGELLDLEISCNGSGPVDYCWKMLPPSENDTTLSCSEADSVPDCSFPIIYYFQKAGTYLLAIYIDNEVSSRQRNVEIHIYDVSLRPQLSFVIIPVVCTVLVLLIVAGAIVVHIRYKRNYDIETADFDFTEEPKAVLIETSWEYMRRSFLTLLRMPYIYCTTELHNAGYGTIVRQ